MRHSIKVERTAHYYKLEPNKSVKKIVFAIHGYAQLVSEFIKQFKPLTEHGIMVIAPEGLSKFYGKNKLPVASWMTSHERKDEIQDYKQYLEDLFSLILKDYNSIEVVVLGFSQGVSTLLRWLSSSVIKISQVHLIAGTIPQEIHNKFIMLDKNPTYFYYYGNQDRLLKESEGQRQIKFIKNELPKSHIIKFDGKHEIPKDCLSQIISN